LYISVSFRDNLGFDACQEKKEKKAPGFPGALVKQEEINEAIAERLVVVG
jgi:hypothetical protein